MIELFRWFRRMGRTPDSFLALLIHARDVQEHEASVSAAFRAGLRVGLAHPEIAERYVATIEEEEGK
ncbi:hypothetical protein HYQ03_gp68 [Arthrobacter phage Kuleana]|uniref:Uncharacterized protein n=1 Tax=Arthrobacter phage Kuleana TaxID=2653270 RepID=A0A5Q2WDQ5_9CAUD|nr:hypothetical protein HYQ03_gp68 [Arthrobacter phage Kuleana]QGH74555.1 hypothetical protein SEA_KULEANA_68 [Arthrobacter phage Kuleana]